MAAGRGVGGAGQHHRQRRVRATEAEQLRLQAVVLRRSGQEGQLRVLPQHLQRELQCREFAAQRAAERVVAEGGAQAAGRRLGERAARAGAGGGGLEGALPVVRAEGAQRGDRDEDGLAGQQRGGGAPVADGAERHAARGAQRLRPHAGGFGALRGGGGGHGVLDVHLGGPVQGAQPGAGHVVDVAGRDLAPHAGGEVQGDGAGLQRGLPPVVVGVPGEHPGVRAHQHGAGVEFGERGLGGALLGGEVLLAAGPGEVDAPDVRAVVGGAARAARVGVQGFADDVERVEVLDQQASVGLGGQGAGGEPEDLVAEQVAEHGGERTVRAAGAGGQRGERGEGAPQFGGVGGRGGGAEAQGGAHPAAGAVRGHQRADDGAAADGPGGQQQPALGQAGLQQADDLPVAVGSGDHHDVVAVEFGPVGADRAGRQGADVGGAAGLGEGCGLGLDLGVAGEFGEGGEDADGGAAVADQAEHGPAGEFVRAEDGDPGLAEAVEALLGVADVVVDVLDLRAEPGGGLGGER